MIHPDSVIDLSQLNNFSESFILSCLLDKFDRGHIYTWLGEDVLVSFNPNQDLTDLYSEKNRRAIAEANILHNIPHVYTLAEKCLRRLWSSNEDHAVIISGLSGSGKTETAKHILHYLVYRNYDKRSQNRVIDASRIETTLLKSNVILESFGNAKTICNRNSSRFGKFMCLHFDANQLLIGSSLQIYLLEKPRSLFDRTTLKSSFHAFRLFLSSLTETEMTEFGLDTLDDEYIKYITNRRMCAADIAAWKELVHSLVALGFSLVDVEQLRLLLAAIVLLNTVRFLPTSPTRVNVPINNRVRLLSHVSTDSSSSKENCSTIDVNGATAAIHPDDVEKVIQAGRLLGLPYGEVADEFTRQLITRCVQAGTGSNTYRSRRLTEYFTTCSVSQAKEQRDCLVKTLYSSLFDFLVQTINDQLNSQSLQNAQREYGILDLFGFEILEENGFEQFCINYANERLHQAFMRIAVNSVQDELNSEGLYRDCLPFNEGHDNSALLTSVKSCAGLLDEVCLLNRVYDRGNRLSNSVDILDAREADWLHRIQTQMASNIHVFVGAEITMTPKAKGSGPFNRTGFNNTSTVNSVPLSQRRAVNCFTVRHFAGPVTYSVSGFVAKNFDRLPTHLINWLVDGTRSDLYQSSRSDGVSTPGLIQSVLARVGTAVVAVPNVSVSPSSCPSPLQQRNLPAGLITTARSSPSEKHSTTRVHLQREAKYYASSLNCLMERLETHRTSFVRCIRPVLTSPSAAHSVRNFNAQIKSSNLSRLCVDEEHVKSQLIAGGLFDALRVLRAAFPARYKYMDFIRRYRMFWRLCGTQPSETLDNRHIAALNDWYSKLFELEQIPPGRTPSSQRRDTGESETQHRQRIVLLLLILGLQLNLLSDDAGDKESDMDPPEWTALIRQFGRTRIHLTRPQIEHLDRIRDLMRLRAVRVIQRWFRHCQASRSHSPETKIPDVQTPSPGRSQSAACTADAQSWSADEIQNPLLDIQDNISGPSSFATHSTHVVSCRCLPNHPSTSQQKPVRYWCSRKLGRLDCLVPFIHIPLAASTCLTRGLIDAVS
ncbi:hypothetical protein D915_005541 [Fasciola hepatica]|uniref:Myosin motor domain-containing protein n=1 Tax=Fasciola hepatica TaxID=6192 RepID=A0A4E0R6U3_FASHE|nr:hypothetical protein D915_005541 [Fasciola hepatica]